MRRPWLTLILMVFWASPCLVLTGCGPSAAEREEAEQQEIEEEDQYTDTEGGEEGEG